MKRKSYLLLIACFLMTLLVVNPVLAARGGNGGSSGGSGKGNSSSNASTSVNKESSGNTSSNAKGQGTENSSKANKANVQTVQTVKTDKANKTDRTTTTKQSKNKVLQSMTESQQTAVKEKITQKRNSAVKKEFTDTNQHWAQKNIDKVQSLGLISGYQDGSFQPDSPVTSAEAMVMTVNLAETLGTDQLIQTSTTTDTTSTTDISSVEATTEGTTDVPQWAQGKAQTASKLGIVNMSRFHSEVQASRAQTAVMLAKALNLEPVDTTNSTFSDSVLISAEDLGYILALKEAGIISGTPGGKFNPNSSITRAEIATMLENAVEAAEGDESTDTTSTDTTAPTTTTDATTGTDTTTPTTTDATTGTDVTTTTTTDATTGTGTTTPAAAGAAE